MNLTIDQVTLPAADKLAAEDKWILTAFNNTVKSVRQSLDNYEIGVALSNLYDFLWDVYCDWYIEITKPRIQAGGETMAKAQAVLVWAMQGMLKLLHPFMPFITEEIWQVLTNEKSMIILETYPTYDSSIDYSAEEKAFEKIISAIKAVRNTRTEMNVPPSVKAKLIIETDEPELYTSCAAFFEKLASASSVEAGVAVEHENCANAVTDSARIFIPMDELVDKEKELARLNKEKAAVQKDIDFSSNKLNNAGFVAKAPAQQVEAEKAKLAKAQEKMAKIEQSIAALMK
jgi:valyl-tRNA synthetase